MNIEDLDTIKFKCDACNREMFGTRFTNYRPAHFKKHKFIKGHWVCSDCIAYDKEKYLEVK